MIEKDTMDALLKEARKTAANAYAPYSNFHVGAALLCEDGKIITGANIENRSFGLTICAERSAVCAAASMGYRRFLALAISTPDSHDPTGPCGACRQVISEFMNPDAPVHFAGGGPGKVETTVGELYPFDSLHELRRG